MLSLPEIWVLIRWWNITPYNFCSNRGFHFLNKLYRRRMYKGAGQWLKILKSIDLISVANDLLMSRGSHCFILSKIFLVRSTSQKYQQSLTATSSTKINNLIIFWLIAIVKWKSRNLFVWIELKLPAIMANNRF